MERKEAVISSNHAVVSRDDQSSYERRTRNEEICNDSDA